MQLFLGVVTLIHSVLDARIHGHTQKKISGTKMVPRLIVRKMVFFGALFWRHFPKGHCFPISHEPVPLSKMKQWDCFQSGDDNCLAFLFHLRHKFLVCTALRYELKEPEDELKSFYHKSPDVSDKFTVSDTDLRNENS